MHLQGATGKNGDYINGLYTPTAKFKNNASVYQKVGDEDIWIEYTEGVWCVKVACKSMGFDCAMISGYPIRALENYPIERWRVNVGSDKWQLQPAISVSSFSNIEDFYAFRESELTEVVHS